ncbi:MAG: class I SAM-dependent rRNA methyltransferase [Planctomycetes bacterium]|nr:class I SAM-dependent rRNA methyltransferase [Planctomycetota bacterium]
MSIHPQVVLHPKKQETFWDGHPWVLRSSIVSPTNELQTGNVVDLVLPDGSFVARGLYHSSSRIAVRLYSWSANDSLDETFFTKRLQSALEFRDKVTPFSKSQGRRLVFSEGDLLSGLIIDQYGDYIIVQQTAAAISRFIPAWIEQLKSSLSPAAILFRIDEKTASAEELTTTDTMLHGSLPAAPIRIRENDVSIEVDLAGGQKTGYYLDQRDNRVAACKYAFGRTLDMFCYTGGFGLTFRRHAPLVTEIQAVDSSDRALNQAQHHIQINDLAPVNYVKADGFDHLKQLADRKEMFDTIVLDPPRLVSSRSQLDSGLRAYFRLNSLAMQMLNHGGTLITCSCSGRVSRDDFRHMLLKASRRHGRGLQILEQRGAAADHPTLLACPETDYLKCFFCRLP